MADIVFVQPIVGQWDDLKSAPSLPLSFLSVASVLVDKFDVKIIDQRIDEDWKAHLKKEMDKQPLFVGTNAITGPQIAHSLEISKFVKDNSNIPVVWGGKHPSILPSQTLENQYIDMIVIGEGELTTLELSNTLKSKKKLTDIKGLAFKENGKININFPREFMDMNTLPEIPYHLLDIKKYLPKYLGVPSLYIETSRGCPQRCQFCYNIEFNKCRWRAMNSEKSLQKIKHGLEVSGAEGIFFVDDSFFTDLKRGKEICEGMCKEKYNVRYGIQGVCLSSVLKMDEEYLRIVEKSGCKKIMLGVESGSERVLKMVQKDVTIPQVIEVNKKLAKTNIRPSYYMMAGFPTETKQELQMTLDLIFRILHDNPKALISPLHCFTPYPGCTMFNLAIQEGFNPPKSLEEWINYSTTSMNALRTDKEKKFYEMMVFLSLFIDDKCKEVVESKLIQYVSKCYQPIARYRMKHQFLTGILSKKAKDIFYPDY